MSIATGNIKMVIIQFIREIRDTQVVRGNQYTIPGTQASGLGSYQIKDKTNFLQILMGRIAGLIVHLDITRERPMRRMWSADMEYDCPEEPVIPYASVRITYQY